MPRLPCACGIFRQHCAPCGNHVWTNVDQPLRRGSNGSAMDQLWISYRVATNHRSLCGRLLRGLETLHSRVIWRNLDPLRAAIRQWEDDHLLRASFSGTITFDLPPAIGQQLAAGQTFGWLVPLHTGPRTARVRIPAGGAGKVEKGQMVLIALADYPRAEFGTLSCKVAPTQPALPVFWFCNGRLALNP
jgi:hypothetical protein